MTESRDVIIGEVLPDEKADGKKKQLVPRKSDNVAFGSFITKSNDLIQRTKYSLPRNEQKILFMMLSKIDQRHDMDASKYYTISFDDFAKLTGVNVDDRNYLKFLKDTIRELANNSFWMDDWMKWIAFASSLLGVYWSPSCVWLQAAVKSSSPAPRYFDMFFIMYLIFNGSKAR